MTLLATFSLFSHQDFVLFQVPRPRPWLRVFTFSNPARHGSLRTCREAQAGERSSIQMHEFLLTRENPAWEYLHADPGTHSIDATPVNRRAIKHIFTQVQAFHGAFLGGGLLLLLPSSPCTWQHIWGPRGRCREAPLTDLPVLYRGDDGRADLS